MKITQLQFSPNPPIYPHTKNKPIQIKNSPSSQSNYSPSQQSLPYYKSNNSNKRLKYFSTRNKQQTAMISEENIEILREEFRKFNDKNFRTLKESSKKDVFNLIVKKYSKKSQSLNQVKDKKSSLRKSTQIDGENLLSRAQKKESNDGKIGNSWNNDEFLQQFASECPQNRDQNPMQHSTKQTYKTHRLYHSSPMASTSNARTIMIPSQRLKRHRFNKSSISHINAIQNKLNHNIQPNNFTNKNNSRVSPFSITHNISNDLSSKNQPLVEQQSYSCLNSARNTKVNTMSRRFIKLNAGQQTVLHTEEEINPYTHRRYLHVAVKSEKQKMKTLEKYLQESVLETNMQHLCLIQGRNLSQSKPSHHKLVNPLLVGLRRGT